MVIKKFEDFNNLNENVTRDMVNKILNDEISIDKDSIKYVENTVVFRINNEINILTQLPDKSYVLNSEEMNKNKAKKLKLKLLTLFRDQTTI